MNLPLQPKAFMHLLYVVANDFILLEIVNKLLPTYYATGIALQNVNCDVCNVYMRDTRSHVTYDFLFVILLILLSIS